ncbi:unnamed protein product, partial [Cylicocyclus nassatus]
MNDELYTDIHLLGFPDEESQTSTYSDQNDSDDSELAHWLDSICLTPFFDQARDGNVEAMEDCLNKHPELLNKYD